jgi:hypothetical protein
MRRRRAPLSHHLHEIPQAQPEAKIPAHASDGDVTIEASLGDIA